MLPLVTLPDRHFSCPWLFCIRFDQVHITNDKPPDYKTAIYAAVRSCTFVSALARQRHPGKIDPFVMAITAAKVIV
jgi:hypothetical protein